MQTAQFRPDPAETPGQLLESIIAGTSRRCFLMT